MDIRLCPYCEENNIEHELDWIDRNSITFDTKCYECGKHWLEHFKFDHREPMNENDPFPNASETLLTEDGFLFIYER